MQITKGIEVHFKLRAKILLFLCPCVFNLKMSSYVDSKLKIFYWYIYCSSNICRHVI